MRALLRLALWGTAACCALAVAAAAAWSSGGSQRLLAALAGRASEVATVQPSAKPPPAPDVSIQLAARLAEAERARQQLAESVRILSADRDRLLARMASLEHNVEDITGSIKRQATPAPAPPPPASAASAPPANTAAVPSPAPVPSPVEAPPAAEKPQAGAEHDSADNEHAEAAAPEPRIGVDVGGAVNFDGLRALWKSLSASHKAMFEPLEPLVSVRENSRNRGVDLRLIAGPLADADAAAKMCAALSSARRFCRATEFVGQKLSLTVAEHERRPVAAPEHRPSPSPSPRPPVRRSP
jgi:hypothetical protein